jgi:hypothetical protein
MPEDNKARGSAMLDNLNNIGNMYTNTYLSLKASPSGTNQNSLQIEKLQATLHSIQRKINSKEDIISTYEREFKDRYELESPFTFWRARGVSTLQDWILLSFFLVYGLVCLSFVALCFNTQYMIYNIIIVSLCCFVIGILLAAIIVRFA